MGARVADEKVRVLVVDDEEGIRHFLRLLLQREGYEVEVAEDGASGLEAVQEGDFDIVLCDIRMPGELDGLGMLDALRGVPKTCEVVMMSAYGSRETALEAVRRGAYDYIDKPIEPDDLLLTLSKLLERKRLERENRQLRAALREVHEDSGIVGRSERFLKLLSRARRAAAFPANILILGETGTGKGLLANAIHRWSPRAEREMVEVNCGAIPANLLESELFGYTRGAFTGAHRDHPGLLQTADGSTLFLDEIGELSLELQVKLLRALEEGVYRRLGETHSRTVDVRIIAATNRDLEAEVRAGRFREDLYHRLKVVVLTIPPLRERAEDIPLLVETYLERFNASYQTNITGVSPDAMRQLLAYDWRGNVRELKNVIESALVQEESSVLTLHSLPEHICAFREESASEGEEIVLPPSLISIKKAQCEVEKILIRRALERTNGNKSAAARLLEISHRALLYKINGYGLG